jgi:hypothetical protein
VRKHRKVLRGVPLPYGLPEGNHRVSRGRPTQPSPSESDTDLLTPCGFVRQAIREGNAALPRIPRFKLKGGCVPLLVVCLSGEDMLFSIREAPLKDRLCEDPSVRRWVSSCSGLRRREKRCLADGQTTKR